MESHTSADTRSGRIGDIDIVDEKERAFEAVEVKHGIAITAQLVKDAFEKFKTTQVNRYYLLSTANIDASQVEEINKEFDLIAIPRVFENAKLSDINLLVDIANIENNDVFKITKMSITNGVISSEEQEAILKEIDEAQKANARLKDMVLHIAIKNS